MNIRTDDALLKAANKAMLITVVIYVLVKQATYMIMFESMYWIPRGVAGVIMLLIALVLPRLKFLSKRHLSWLIPISLALTEIILVANYDGDRLIYIFLIGIALLSLLYMDTAGLLVTVIVSCVTVAFCLFIWGRTLIGIDFEFYDDMFNFLGMIVINILVYLIGKYGIGTLTKSKQVVEEALFEAQNANRAKTNFLATMSHEIRTPMNAILGIAQLQLNEEDLPDKYAQAVTRIIDSGNTLLGIINDILDMSKIDSGNMELVVTRFDVPVLINDAVQLNIVRIGSNPIEFVLDIDENLPSKLYGDELRLKQILNNLLSNAIKYTEKGEVRLSIRSELDNNNNSRLTTPNSSLQTPNLSEIRLIIKVSDTGQGMKPEDCEKLFSGQYTRFNAEANRTTEGTGLGLSITKRLIELMNGEITVESEYGKGSVFTVSVVLRAEECTPIGHDVAASLRDFSYTDNRFTERRALVRNLMPYGRVLVVDDVESNLYIVEGMLSKYKINTEAVSSGFKAIEKVEGGNVYDVIFMDHMMPRMDGIETTRKLRDMGYGGGIVALTANALVGNDEMFLNNGFDGFISKPIDIQKLDAVLNKFIRDRHPQEASQNEQQTDSMVDKSMIDITKLHRAFCRDAGTAVKSLHESLASGDAKELTAAAHSMKSALANIGENELSSRAAALENAGKNDDKEYISANAESFTQELEALISRFRHENDKNNSPVGDGVLDVPITENANLLSEHLEIIKTACENYDDTKVYNVLDKLREKTWNSEITGALEDIRDALYIDSDFEKAANLAEELGELL